MMLRFSLRKTLWLTPLLACALFACGKDGFKAALTSPLNKGQTAPVPTPGAKDQDLAICSNLSLKNVTWPDSLNHSQKRALALALNISGSFEGSVGWRNITNNFDGQGLSLGLLNQCLGQGSLQPMFVKMRDRARSPMEQILSTAHMTSLLGMMSKWESAQSASSFTSFSVVLGDEDLMPDGRASYMDLLPEGSDGIAHEQSPSGDSVTWAKQNLYTDGGATFVTTWKKELQALSAEPHFVSIQIEAALKNHAKSLGYMKTLGLHELRSYLTMFDIVVQNGSLYAEDIAAYLAALPLSVEASETARLKKIVELRLRHVVAKYKADVESRKMSLINGRGIVHQTSRDYEKEHCFEGSTWL